MSSALSPRQKGIRRELRRRYWFPCRGYWSSQSRDALPPGVVTGDSTADSYNWLVSGQGGQLIRRQGISYLGESDVTAQVGLLEAVSKNLSMNMVCRHMLDVQYPGLESSVTGPTALYTDALDTGHFGQIFSHTSTDGTRKVLGHEMGTLASPGTTHYPRSTASTRPNFRMIPLPYMAGGSGTQAVGYNRCTFPLMRALMCGGAMKMCQSAQHLLWGSLHGAPGKWDRRSNPSTSTGTEQVHIGPWGHITPLFAPYLVSSNVATGSADQIWWEGDQFYLSVVFQMDDGSFSAPYQNRVTSGALNNKGLITAGTFVYTSVDAFKSLTIGGIAIGPPGTKARLLCRTRKTNVSDASAAGGVRPLGMTPQGTTSDIDAGGRKLFVFAKINNNTQTTYEMVESNDNESLLDDPIAINFFTTWPLPARYCFEMERRFGLGYTRRQNPCAIILAPTRSTADYDLNVPEDTAAGADTPYGIYAYCFRLFRDNAGTITLQTRRSTIGAAGISTASVNITATKTIQTVIDEINADVLSTGASSTGKWAAQAAPGCDPNILASYLAPTAMEINPCTLSTTSTITSSGLFADVAIGMRLRVQSGTGTIPANAVVIGKASDSSITIGTENGASAVTTAGTASVQFWSDTGDDSWSTDTANWGIGNVRSFCGAYPGVLALKGSYLDALTIDKRGLMFSSSPPGGSSLAAQTFLNQPGNRKDMPAEAGIFMGAAAVFPNTVVCGSEATYVLKNVKNTNTGEDQDYHLFPLSPRGRGCIQYGTVVAGDGWAGYLTREGYVVTDGEREAIISAPLLDPAHSGRGLLAYQCIGLSTTNGVADLPAAQTAHAYIHDGTLRLTFTPNAALA